MDEKADEQTDAQTGETAGDEGRSTTSVAATRRGPTPGPTSGAHTPLVALLLVALVATGLSVWLYAGRDDAGADPSTSSNKAVVDTAATDQVVRDVTAAMTQLWSYDYRQLPTARAGVAAVSTSEFAEEYRPIFDRIEKLAPATKAVVTATVRQVGVQSLADDAAVAVVFLDQAASKGGGDPVTAGARLRVRVVLNGGLWRVAGVTPF